MTISEENYKKGKKKKNEKKAKKKSCNFLKKSLTL